MSILRVEGREITYVSVGRPNIVHFEPYEDTLYRCTVCNQEFAAWQEDLLYRKVREVRKAKSCPPCHTPLRQCLVTQERIPWRDAEREDFDHTMRAKGYTKASVRDGVWREYPNIFSLD